MTATGPEGDLADTVLVDAVRREVGPVVAGLHRLTGDFDVAEEAVQDALVSAVAAWRRDGPPPNPGAWLTLTARRKAVDRLRREAAVAGSPRRSPRPGSRRPDRRSRPLSWSDTDERVAMLFGCCHPALAVEVRLALTLRSVAGLTTEQVAHAFLVPEATLAQRIVRRETQDRRQRHPYGGPRDAHTGAPRRRPHGRLPHVQRRLRRRRLARPRRGRGLARRGPDDRPPRRTRGVGPPGPPHPPAVAGGGPVRTGGRAGAPRRPGPRPMGPPGHRPRRALPRTGRRVAATRPVPAPGGDRGVPRERPPLRRDGLAADPHPLRPAAAPRPVADGPAQPAPSPWPSAPDPLRPSRRSTRWPAPSTHTTCGTPPGRTCSDEWVGWTRPPRRTGGRSTSPRYRPSRRSCASG